MHDNEDIEHGGGGGVEMMQREPSESKENMVLESEVEIVVQEEESEDGWEADGEDDYDGLTSDDGCGGEDMCGFGVARGRRGMSLSRRDGGGGGFEGNGGFF